MLVGLLFVSLSLHLNREASHYDAYRLGTQTMIDPSLCVGGRLVGMRVPIATLVCWEACCSPEPGPPPRDSLRTIARHGWLHGWTHYVSLGCFAVGV